MLQRKGGERERRKGRGKFDFILWLKKNVQKRLQLRIRELDKYFYN